MKRNIAGDIELVADAPPPTGRFFVQAKLPDDDESGHPYGQWSLAVEPVAEFSQMPPGRPFRAFLAFVSAEAPHDALKRGAQLGLFRGTHRVGTAYIARGLVNEDVSGLPPERDFLPSTGEDFLGAA